MTDFYKECLYKETEIWRQTHTETETRLSRDRGRDWRDAAANPRKPRITSNHQKIGRGKKGFFPRALRGSTALLTP